MKKGGATLGRVCVPLSCAQILPPRPSFPEGRVVRISVFNITQITDRICTGYYAVRCIHGREMCAARKEEKPRSLSSHILKKLTEKTSLTHSPFLPPLSSNTTTTNKHPLKLWCVCVVFLITLL